MVEYSRVAVLVVPFPAQGHLNPLLHLSCHLASYGLPVHYAGSSVHNRQAKTRLHGWQHETDHISDKIQFHDLHFTSNVPNLNPSPKTDDQNQFPSHLQPLVDATPQLRQQLLQLLLQLSNTFTKVIVINDYFMSSVVQDAKSIPNIETYTYFVVSAFAAFFHFWESMPQKPFELGSDIIPACNVPSNEGCFTPEFTEFMENQGKFAGSESGFICNTSRLIEGRYLELLEKLSGYDRDVKTFAIGPLHPMPKVQNNEKQQKHVCLEWLEKRKTACSVIYVSFGSTTTMTDKQIEELAIGLERSEQAFLWVLRKADKGDVFEGEQNITPVLPQGYEERVKDRGIVVRDWVPQPDILGHPSVGGFMSHCGWNSCLESISMGVPILAWPLASDQPKHAILVTEVLRMGTLVRDWASRTDIVSSVAIQNAITRLMASEQGLEMRGNAQKLGIQVRGSVAQGGVSRLEMDSFVARITS